MTEQQEELPPLMEKELLDALLLALSREEHAESTVVEEYGEIRLYWRGQPAIVYVGQGRPDWRPSQ